MQVQAISQGDLLPQLRKYVSECWLNDSGLREAAKNSSIFVSEDVEFNKIFSASADEIFKLIGTKKLGTEYTAFTEVERGICLGISTLWVIGQIFDAYPENHFLRKRINSGWLLKTMQLIASLSTRSTSSLTEEEKKDIGLFFVYCLFLFQYRPLNKWSSGRNPKLREGYEVKIVQSYPFFEEEHKPLAKRIETLITKNEGLQISAIVGSHNHVVAFTVSKNGNKYIFKYSNSSAVKDLPADTQEKEFDNVEELAKYILTGAQGIWSAFGYSITICLIGCYDVAGRLTPKGLPLPSMENFLTPSPENVRSYESIVKSARSRGHNWTPVTAAANIGNVEALRFYSNSIGKKNFLNEFIFADTENCPLGKIIANGHIDCLKFVLSCFASEQQLKQIFMTNALWIAAFMENIECMKILLDDGADIDKVPRGCTTSPLMITADSEKCKEFILKYQAEKLDLAKAELLRYQSSKRKILLPIVIIGLIISLTLGGSSAVAALFLFSLSALSVVGIGVGVAIVTVLALVIGGYFIVNKKPYFGSEPYNETYPSVERAKSPFNLSGEPSSVSSAVPSRKYLGDNEHGSNYPKSLDCGESVL